VVEDASIVSHENVENLGSQVSGSPSGVTDQVAIVPHGRQVALVGQSLERCHREPAQGVALGPDGVLCLQEHLAAVRPQVAPDVEL